MLDYKPSPTGAGFLASRAFVKGIMGPVGSGKSTVALIDLLQRAVQQEPYSGVRYTRLGVLRNTMQQLRSTVKPLIDMWFIAQTGGRMGRWYFRDNAFEARFMLEDGTQVHSDFILLAADTPDDVRRLLSLELTAAWQEESREVEQKVAEGLQGRVNRYPPMNMGGATYPGVTFTTNAPDLDSYWHKLIVEPPGNADIFIQPPAVLEDGALNPDAENLENLAPDYYDNLVEGKTDEWIDVYLRNKFGLGKAGKPVFAASFKTTFHTASAPLLPVMQARFPLIIGMDNGLQAAASITQRDAVGRVNVLAECFVPEDTTMGVESFLDRLLVPLIQENFPRFRRDLIWFALDPACFDRSQVDEKTIAMAVQQRGFGVLKVGTNDPERRIQAVEGLLAMQVDGGPALRIDPGCKHLIAALEYGYRYKKGSGQLRFDKTHPSHQAESLQYACLHHNYPTAPIGHKTQARQVVPSRHVYAAPTRSAYRQPSVLQQESQYGDRISTVQ